MTCKEHTVHNRSDSRANGKYTNKSIRQINRADITMSPENVVQWQMEARALKTFLFTTIIGLEDWLLPFPSQHRELHQTVN